MWSGRSHTGKACPVRLPCVRGVVGGGVQGSVTVATYPFSQNYLWLTSARRGRKALPTHRCTPAPGPQGGAGLRASGAVRPMSCRTARGWAP